jgi:glucokinase
MLGSQGKGPVRVLGLDVGATKVSAALVKENGKVYSPGGLRLHSNAGPEAVIAELVEAARRSLGPEGLADVIGVGVAAQVDAATGTVAYAPNLGWRNVPIGPILSKEFGCPVFVTNDVRAAAVGEWRYGAGAGARHLLCLWVGTGVGGAFVHDGTVLEGASNALGEVGHTQLIAGGRQCHCPARGCLEAYVGGWAIAARAQDRVKADPQRGMWLVEKAGSVEAIDAKVVAEVARTGDSLANEIMRVTATYIAGGVAGLVNAFNPDRVVLGGGVIEGWPEFVQSVRERVRSDCQPPAARVARVVRSSLGRDAIIIGAATLARDQFRPVARAAPSRPAARRPAARKARSRRG